MPIIQVLLIGVIGAYLASGFSNVLTTSARRDMNKVSSVIQFSTHLFFLSLQNASPRKKSAVHVSIAKKHELFIV